MALRTLPCLVAPSIFLLSMPFAAFGQDPSIARQWNEQLLGAISRDFARPPVHARNLFQTSAAMYDAWGAYDPNSEPYLLGRLRGMYDCPFDGVAMPTGALNIEAARHEAISFAMYRMIVHRFQNSPGILTTQQNINALMAQLGYDITNVSTDYVHGGAAELGNYIAQQYIAYGFTDGSNEVGNYAGTTYTVSNPPIEVELPGNPDIIDPNLWQQITLTNAFDQAGNPVFGTPPPLGHDWGKVVPFALDPAQATEYDQNGNIFKVYKDPGAPAYIDTLDPSGLESFYKWSFTMVSVWQSHLDPDDTTMWDISPATIGNIQAYPDAQDWDAFRDFYDYTEGGVVSPGHTMNPVTGLPYQPQIVKRGDYTRILAEFWADGPQSVTPPGHWFEIMHDVMDHPLFERRWMGQGEILDDLEYDIKAHFTMGGTMHDAAMTAWSIKGWYDYLRPVSAIRYMGDKGQCSDPLEPNFHPAGLPIVPGYIEQVVEGDPLAGDLNEHVGKMKLYTWRGPEYIDDSEEDYAGVGWILAENWWPYQRPWFVTPPFSGYISGHSTYSSTAAEMLTLMTGDPFFPGGLSNYYCPQDDFLEFEIGPSEDVYLQWATYRDASDQCSLSRIWGGIHPPMDDIAGRHIGIEIGSEGVALANSLFGSLRPVVVEVVASDEVINITDIGSSFTVTITYDRPMDISVMPTLQFMTQDPLVEATALVGSAWTTDSTFTMTLEVLPSDLRMTDIFLRIDDAIALDGFGQDVSLAARPFLIDTDRPTVTMVGVDNAMVNSAVATAGQLSVLIAFGEACDTLVQPTLAFSTTADLSTTLLFDTDASAWLDPFQYEAVYNIIDNDDEVEAIGLLVSGVVDLVGNGQVDHDESGLFDIDTRDPGLLQVNVSDETLIQQDAGSLALIVTLSFDEAMDTGLTPNFAFPDDDPLGSSLFLNPANTSWLNDSTYQRAYNMLVAEEELFNITVELVNFTDVAGNAPTQISFPQLFSVDTRRPSVSIAAPSVQVVSDSEVGPGGMHFNIEFDEPMDAAQAPIIQLVGATGLDGSLTFSAPQSAWSDAQTFMAVFNVQDEGREEDVLGLSVSFARDAAGNNQLPFVEPEVFSLDTRNPELVLLTANTYVVTNGHVGAGGLTIASIFDELMDPATSPTIDFLADTDVNTVLTLDPMASQWLNSSTYRSVYDVANIDADIIPISLMLDGATDMAGNMLENAQFDDFLAIDVEAVGVDEQGVPTNVSVFPNPIRSGDRLMLRTGVDLTGAHVRLYDAPGRMVHAAELGHIPAGTYALRLPELAAGAYSVHLHSSAGQHVSRVVVSAP